MQCFGGDIEGKETTWKEDLGVYGRIILNRSP
jgi:hypothetical protein